MSFEDWERPEPRRAMAHVGMGALRVAMLFGVGAGALALILTPIMDEQTQRRVAVGHPGIDWTATGSVGQPRSGGTYVIRRSVLQSSPDATCIIRPDGRVRGDC